MFILVPKAELGAFALAGAAIALSVRPRRDGSGSKATTWGLRLAVLVLTLVIGGNLVGLVLSP